MDETDADLVEGVRGGSRDAAARLAERYLRGCRAVALAIIGEIAGSEDVSQDAFVYAMARIDDCREPARFGAWLRQIVRSKALNHVRDRKEHRHVSVDTIERADGLPSPAENAERSDLRARLLAGLARLSEERREIVLLHDLEGWTHQEIADRMELPSGTVRSHLHHARKALRGFLAELWKE